MTVDASGTSAGLHLALVRTDIDSVCTSRTSFFEPVKMPLLAMYSNGERFVTVRPPCEDTAPRGNRDDHVGGVRPAQCGPGRERRCRRHRPARLPPTTIEGYERMLRLHILPTLGSVPLGQIRADAVQTSTDSCRWTVATREPLHVAAGLPRRVLARASLVVALAPPSSTPWS